jgi:Uma2 family endonuclease
MATTAPPASRTAAPFGGERIILHGVPWETYERLLTDYADRRVPRFNYDRGRLEIVVALSTEHEETNRTLAFMVGVVTAELTVDVRDVGGMTYHRAEIERGFEPDSSFYIQHEPQVRERRQIDLSIDPPPDLVIEIDVSRDSLPKLPLYATFGVPEVWRYDGERVRIHVLQAESYQESAVSRVLPPMTGEAINRFLGARRTLPSSAWVRLVQEWARRQGADLGQPSP